MAKKPTASVPAQKKKKTGTTLQELEKIQVDSLAKHIKAQRTTSKYRQNVAAGRKWLAEYFPTLKKLKDNMSKETPDDAMDIDDDVDGSEQADDQERQAQADEDTEEATTGSAAAQDKASTDENPYDDPEFKNAFNNIPNQYSDKALALYISFKCFHEDLKEGTGQSVKAGFKHLWDNIKGAKYRERWHQNSETKEWEGNPALSAEVDDTMKAVKHKSGAEGGDRNHSRAMSKEHMEKMFDWSKKVCPDEFLRTPAKDLAARGLQTKHLEFRAFAATAWTIWSRNFELIKLKKKHLQMNIEDPDAFGLLYHELFLYDRKGWQKQVDRNKRCPDLRSNKFKIYAQPNLPACDAFKHLQDWIEYLERDIYKRPLDPEDYLFPAMGAGTILQPREMISADTVQKWINEFTMNAGIRSATLGSFTTHCFRRGGAQYRFMFAPVGERWTLKRVRWWGGWAEGEHRDTLIKYLLDELHSYEQDYSDGLCPIQKELDKSFMGEHKSIAPITNETFHVMHTQLTSEVQFLKTAVVGLKDSLTQITSALVSSHFNTGTTTQTQITMQTHNTSLHIPPQQCTTSNQRPAFAFDTPQAQLHGGPQLGPQLTGPTAGSQTQVPSTTAVAPSAPMVIKPGRKLPTHTNIIPDLPLTNRDGTKALRKESWRAIVEHWLRGDVERGLQVPLKDWPQDWLKGPNRTIFGTKHHQRAMIATEFINQFASDDVKFLAAYPVANEGHSGLFSAIEAARIARGDIIPRPRRGGTTAL